MKTLRQDLWPDARILANSQGIINFKLFGGVEGDSSTAAKLKNDAVWLECIKQLHSVKGNTICFPAGTWYFSKQLYIEKTNGFSIKGAGMDATFITGFNVDQNGIVVRDCNHVTLSDFEVSGVTSNNPPTTERKGIRIDGGCNNVLIRRCRGKNNDDANIAIEYYNGSSENVVNSNVVIEDCIAESSPHGAGIEAFHCEKLIIRNCEIFGNNQHGLRLNSDVFVEVHGCKIHDNGNHGISCQAQPDFWGTWHVARDFRIYSNDIRDNPYGVVIFNRVSGLKLWGNRIYRTAAGDNLYGVYFNSGSGGICADNVQIFRNDIEKYSGGVMINPSSYTLENIQIEENNILDSAAATTGDVFGVRLNGNANHKRIYVRRNLIRTAQAKGSPIFTYGIIMANAGSQLYCQHNQIYMNAPNAYLSNSATAVVVDPGGATDTNLTGSY